MGRISPTDLALLGFGNVGRALARQLDAADLPLRVTSITDRSGTIVDETGLPLDVVLEAKREEGDVTAAPGRLEPWCPQEAAAQAPADVVVQLTPSDLEDPERGLAEIEAALANDRSLVTAAKDALARRPRAVERARRKSAGSLACSAAVGGSTPVLETLERGFAGGGLERVTGVLNGSTTAMLSRMEEGERFGEALDAAQEAGLLEADAKADLLGLDAGAKAAILHQRAFGSKLGMEAVSIEGITDVDPAACRQARKQGFAVRLVAKVDADGASVRPVHLPREGPLATEGARAAVQLTFAHAGEIVLQGPGAGPTETAAAVLSDVLATQRTDDSAAAASPAGSPIAVGEAEP